MDDYHQQYGVHYHAIDEKNIYVTTPDIGKYSYMERDLVGMPIVQQPLDQFDPNATFSKMMFVDEPEILENLIPNLSDSFKENHNIVRSMPVYLEVLHPQASKGHAVAKLAELLGLDASEVMCIGDQGNDRDMIEYAGMGVAMGNAIDEIKALANFITTTCDEDGVAVAVETHVLNTENSLMIHSMNLAPSPFEMIASGKKTIELRLNDEKRRKIQIGDFIQFTNVKSPNESILCEVIQLHPFENFASLYEALPLLSCGYTASTIRHAHPDDMRMYYSKEEEDTYGVVGIELKLITEK